MNDSTNVPAGGYDGLNRPVTWENTQAGDVPFARSHYQYDAVGREAATWRDEQSAKGEKFWYTTTGQLSAAEYNAEQVWTGDPANWDRWVGYSYTPDMLNRTNVNDNGSITNYAASPLNQYVSTNGETIYHDANFNVSMHGGWFYSYDAQNRLTSVRDWTGAALLENTYDGLGRCVKRVGYEWGGGVMLTTYDGWKPIVEWDGAGNFQAWNVYGPGADEILWRYDIAEGHLRYHHDIHGSVTTLLDVNGNPLEKYTYDAFGKPRIVSWVNEGWDELNWRTWSTHRNRFMFTGREWYPFLWLYDYRHRWYDPELGRFLQTDALGLHTEGEKLTPGQAALFWGGHAPEAFGSSETNLFRYCGDEPVDASDPLGLRRLAAGLLDVDDDVLKRTYDNAKKAAEDSVKTTDRRTQTERRIDTYKDANGNVQSTGQTQGYKYPSPQAPPPKLPRGVSESQRKSQAHDHVGSPAVHYGGDKGSANDIANPNGAGLLPLVSSVSSTMDGGIKQEFYIPSTNVVERAANRGGAYFFTTNGIDFVPAPYH